MPARRPLRALVALLLMTIIWGWTFTWVKQSLEAATGLLGAAARPGIVAWYIVVRFGIAAATLGALVPSARRRLDGAVWRAGALLGGALLVGFVFQMIGLTSLSPGVSAFLTSLYVVFTAILTGLRGTHRVTLPLLMGVVLATFGAGFIDGPPHLGFGAAEWLTVASAFVFAIHILMTDELTRRLPPMPLTLASFVWVVAGAVAALLGSLALPGAADPGGLWSLLVVPRFVGPLLLTSFLATVGALSIMNLFQREVDPVRAAVLYALEPVWASAIAIASGYGQAGRWLWIGGTALLAGNLVAEWGARPRVT